MRISRALAVFLVGVVLLSGSVPARAADDSSDVVIEVVDATGGAPVSLARVILQGETSSIGYTDADGRARFESQATGAYRAQVGKRGYTSARSSLFDVIARRTTTVRVRLAKVSAIKQIGSVSVSTAPARSSREVGQDDALRHLDGSLRDAIGDLPGVTTSGDGFAVDGNDPSQTGATIDGVAIPGAGGAFGDRGINADLFAGAGASSGAANGALGGSINFRTLQPTRLPQSQATLQYGSDNSSAAQFATRGSLRNLGYVFEHVDRGRTNGLTGLDFTDLSGFDYRHDGDRFSWGDLAKLRWSPSLSQTLTFTATSTGQTSGDVCQSLTAFVPCGSGPNLYTHQHGSFATLAENAVIGATAVSLTGAVSGSRSDNDQQTATFLGAPAPAGFLTNTLSRGMSLGIMLPAGDRHDLSLNASTFGFTSSGSLLNTLGTFPFSSTSRYESASILDRVRPNQRLTLTASGGVNGGTGTSALGSLDVRWQPFRDLAYDISGSAGNVGSGIVIGPSALPDPRSLTYDCATGTATGPLSVANAATQRSSTVRASVERSAKRGRLLLTAWSQNLIGAPLLTAVDPATAGVPASYLSTVNAIAASPLVCGGTPLSLAFTAFNPANQRSSGATVSGTYQAGTALFAGYGSVQSRVVTGGVTPGPSLLAPIGSQVPDTPLHRGGIVGTVKLGRAVDALANISYTAANNPNRLPAYSVVNAGLAMPLREGSLALVGTNLMNRFAGPFVTPFATHGLALPATPLGPRAVGLTYTVRVGRLGSAGSGVGNTDASAGDGGEVRIQIRARELPAVIATDALTIDPDNDNCSPIAARVAQPAMDAIGTIRDAAERAKRDGRYPASLARVPTEVAGVRLQYIVYAAGAHYAVSIGGSLLQIATFINCARLATGDRDEFAKRGLYVPAPDSKTPFNVLFSPLVGMYFSFGAVAGMVRTEARSEPEPATPPSEPFALRAECPAASKPLAEALIAAVRAARDASRAGRPIPSADVAEIVGHGDSPFWLALKPTDEIGGVVAFACLHIAGIPASHLAAAGIADARRSGLGFSDRFGFYSIAPDVQQRLSAPSN